MKKLLRITLIALIFISIICTISNAKPLPSEEEIAFYNEHIILIKTVLFFTNIMQVVFLILGIVIPIILIVKKKKLSYRKNAQLSILEIWSIVGLLFFTGGFAVHLANRESNSQSIAMIILIMIIYIIYIVTTILKLLKKEENEGIKKPKKKNN